MEGEWRCETINEHLPCYVTQGRSAPRAEGRILQANALDSTWAERGEKRDLCNGGKGGERMW